MEDLINNNNTSEIKNESENTEIVTDDNKNNNHAKNEILDWIKTLFFYCVIPVLLFECFFFMAQVPTGSMETTIPTGSRVFTVRCFNKDNIKRGDIVVFNSDETGLILIKRCIGIPGDTIVFDGDGSVKINGEYIDEEYVSSFSDYEGTFEVPDDCYFFCGDNRKGSFDARYWEQPYINKNEIIGKAKFIIFPFSSFGILN